jgi:formylglycine-generating enzyme required for sulfatase activity
MDAFPRDVTPNGIFCLAGNVSEWVEDTALFYIKRSGNPGLIDPRAFGRYNRGSSWKSNSAENCKVSEAARGWLNPRALVNDVGFRCVKSPYPDFSRN